MLNINLLSEEEIRQIRKRARDVRYRNAHRELCALRTRLWQKEHPDACRANVRSSRRRKYGAPIASGEVKFGLCAICGLEAKLSLDHDHVTNKFRGWLCPACNTMLGFAKDNSQTLIKAAAYVNGGANS